MVPTTQLRATMHAKPLKVSLTGPESSGKSTLTSQLAAFFNAPYVEEFAREFLKHTAGQYNYNDLERICLGQQELNKRASSIAKQVVFFDTDMLVLYIWSEFRFGNVSPMIEKALLQSDVDLYLLCKPDIDWSPDPFRESPLQRERDQLFEMYEQKLKLISAKYIIIHGSEASRFEIASLAVKGLLKQDFF